MRIRKTTVVDREAIHEVHTSAFPAEERALVSKLAVDLLEEQGPPETLSLLAEIDGRVAGHVAFSPVTASNDPGFRGYILAPLGVMPAYQNQRVGSALVGQGMALVTETGADMLLVYGDPAYYGRFGFAADLAGDYRPPYPLQYPFGWLAFAPAAYESGESPLDLAFVPSLNNPALW